MTEEHIRAIEQANNILFQVKLDLKTEYEKPKPNKKTVARLMNEKKQTIALIHELQGTGIRLGSLIKLPEKAGAPKINKKPYINKAYELMKNNS